ncbi:hypothetical protein DPX16_4593 [Anabarilius grahami]|uniref:Uncharacterized protein n=1 Tax=Anabarilius grahami TaxID=495550 RepID=A0A3N0YBZ6_ANAGA|nr:hypothetical protein DPX16_4593 [Anabarilius grahami]
MFAATLEKARSPRRMQTVEAGEVDVMSRAGQDDWRDERLDFIEALESQKCYLTPEDLKYISNSILSKYQAGTTAVDGKQVQDEETILLAVSRDILVSGSSFNVHLWDFSTCFMIQQRISFVRAVKPLTAEREKERKVSALGRPVRGSSFCSLCSSCSARKASETTGLKKAFRLIETHLANLCVTSPPPDPNVTPAFTGCPVRTRSPPRESLCARPAGSCLSA